MTDELPQHDECDTDDPLVAAALGLAAVIDDLIATVGDCDDSSRGEKATEPAAPFDLAVLGLLSVRRTLAHILSGIVEVQDSPPPRSTGPTPSPRPRDLLR